MATRTKFKLRHYLLVNVCSAIGLDPNTVLGYSPTAESYAHPPRMVIQEKPTGKPQEFRAYVKSESGDEVLVRVRVRGPVEIVMDE